MPAFHTASAGLPAGALVAALPLAILQCASWAVISIGVMQALLHLIQLVLAARALADRPPEMDAETLWRRYAETAPPVSILAPAYNEQEGVVESTRSLLSLRYPALEVIVINDGSRDETLARLVEAFDLIPAERECAPEPRSAGIRGAYTSALFPALLVVDKINAGKADALNAGLRFARAPLFASIDADSLLDRDAILRGVVHFLEDPARTLAVGGAIAVCNGSRVEMGLIDEQRLPRNPLALVQVVEYMRAFVMARTGWSEAGALTIVSGAFGLFRRSAVVAAGGYQNGTVGEDMELVVRLRRRAAAAGRPARIVFAPEAVCWTEVPESLRILARQRSRWHRGAMETLMRHGVMALNPRYGRFGVIGMTGVVVVDLLGPIAELIGYLAFPVFAALGWLDWSWCFAFLSLNVAIGMALTLGAIHLESRAMRRIPRASDLAWLLAAAIGENFGYRQLNTWWRLKGMWQWMRGDTSWGDMTRKGLGR
jgi:cellulose synthase/poly-beta-1,6-N-acetylglucosamine synthase-like glycosyltransferase